MDRWRRAKGVIIASKQAGALHNSHCNFNDEALICGINDWVGLVQRALGKVG